MYTGLVAWKCDFSDAERLAIETARLSCLELNLCIDLSQMKVGVWNKAKQELSARVFFLHLSGHACAVVKILSVAKNAPRPHPKLF